MESWIESIGTAPIATLIVGLCTVIAVMARHIVKLHDARIEDQRQCMKLVTDLTASIQPALSSAGQGMAASAAAMTTAREAMQVATAVMERSAK